MIRAPHLLFLLGAAALLLLGCSADPDPSDNPFVDRAQTAVANARLGPAAAQAEADGRAEDAERLRRIGDTPTGIWLTPEEFPETEVASYVAGIVEASVTESTVPVFVLYGIPDRDCTGEFSAGGLTADTYLPWVRAIAAAAGTTSVVVLEPDALASVAPTDSPDSDAAARCSERSTRIDLLDQAIGILDEAEVTTYVDAGHSFWVPAEDMAALLREVGAERVRGFATNVANYQSESAERAYAAQLSGLIDDAHYIIDIGREGDPEGTGDPVSEWCNPSGRALGSLPGFVDDDSGLDALLWIKPPAESDGTCNGGPPAGDIWIERALELATAAGW